MTAQIHEGWVSADGIRTHYAWSGTDGPPVLLIHGTGPGSSGEAGWSYLMPLIADAGYRALAPDRLSMGLTDTRPHAWPVLGHRSLTAHNLAFLDALCLRDIAGIVGASMGAYTAITIALERPEDVGSLILISSGTLAQAIGLTHDIRGTPLADYDYSLEAMRRFLSSIVYDQTKLTDELVIARHEAANQPGIREARDAFAEYRSRMQQDPRLQERFLLRDLGQRLTTPTKLIWGAEDHFAPVELGYKISAELPTIDFEVIADAGHQCQTDQPEVVCQIVIDCLGRGIGVKHG